MIVLKLRAGRAANDPEKMVTPGIIFCKKHIGKATGMVLALGWWDLHVSLFVVWVTAEAHTHGV